MKPITSSATAFAFAPGRLMMAMPCSRAASVSMLSIPLVPWAISSNRGAASITRRVTRLYARVTSTSAFPTIAASSSSVRTGVCTTANAGSLRALSWNERSTSAATRSVFGIGSIVTLRTLGPFPPQTRHRADRDRGVQLRRLLPRHFHGTRAVAERRLLQLQPLVRAEAGRRASPEPAAQRSADRVLHAALAGEKRLARVSLESLHSLRRAGLRLVAVGVAHAADPPAGAAPAADVELHRDRFSQAQSRLPLRLSLAPRRAVRPARGCHRRDPHRRRRRLLRPLAVADHERDGVLSRAALDRAPHVQPQAHSDRARRVDRAVLCDRRIPRRNRVRRVDHLPLRTRSLRARAIRRPPSAIRRRRRLHRRAAGVPHAPPVRALPAKQRLSRRAAESDGVRVSARARCELRRRRPPRQSRVQELAWRSAPRHSQQLRRSDGLSRLARDPSRVRRSHQPPRARALVLGCRRARDPDVHVRRPRRFDAHRETAGLQILRARADGAAAAAADRLSRRRRDKWSGGRSRPPNGPNLP